LALPGLFWALKVLIRPYKALYLDKIPDIEGLTKSSEKPFKGLMRLIRPLRPLYS
jgi:hypothetical protein